MAVKKENSRINVTIPPDVRKQLEVLAQEQSRSLSNLVLQIVKTHLDEIKNK